MKGIIFTEFLELVEDKFGLELLEEVLDMSEDEGIYTSVGSYDHKNLVKLIINLSKKTNIDAASLQRVFGQSVFKNLLASIPNKASLKHSNTTFQFIQHVEHYIHVEVKKLYPDAEPPEFSFITTTEAQLIFDYKSARCMSHVCLGLIEGCADYYSESIVIEMTPQNDEQSVVRFNLKVEK
ncbi:MULTISPECIES: heme NO-binding domain-containing protein [Vibrio]|uniref:Heme NO-binding domain-containing protein n=2 Tax=Vibrio TaxID=662 RepID=A0ABV4LG09_9VIBR|nr:heme NO-binding domain-containing protein [Vibrio kanaloae]OEF14605.1 guanylate cyclase [Vibrio kanaloae 5S-149]